MLDVNDLKITNDTHGHEMGDVLLQNTAKILQESVGGRGTVYRLGGDEFVILFTNIDAMGMDEELQRIEFSRQKMNEVRTDDEASGYDDVSE